jgi:hypothetical protein
MNQPCTRLHADFYFTNFDIREQVVYCRQVLLDCIPVIFDGLFLGSSL